MSSIPRRFRTKILAHVVLGACLFALSVFVERRAVSDFGPASLVAGAAFLGSVAAAFAAWRWVQEGRSLARVLSDGGFVPFDGAVEVATLEPSVHLVTIRRKGGDGGVAREVLLPLPDEAAARLRREE